MIIVFASGRYSGGILPLSRLPHFAGEQSGRKKHSTMQLPIQRRSDQASPVVQLKQAALQLLVYRESYCVTLQKCELSSCAALPNPESTPPSADSARQAP